MSQQQRNKGDGEDIANERVNKREDKRRQNERSEKKKRSEGKQRQQNSRRTSSPVEVRRAEKVCSCMVDVCTVEYVGWDATRREMDLR